MKLRIAKALSKVLKQDILSKGTTFSGLFRKLTTSQIVKKITAYV